jgi:zinc protease
VTIVDRPAAEQSEILVGRPGAARADPAYVPLVILNTVLGGSFTSRLMQNLREKHGYTYGAASQFGFRRGPGPFAAGAAVKTTVTEDAMRQLLLELERIAREDVSKEELDKARTIEERGLPQLFQDNASVAGLLLDLWVHGLPLGYYGQYAKRVRAVRAPDVKRLARRYVAPAGAAIVIVGERRVIAPQLEKLGLPPPAVRDADGRLIK